MTEGADQFALRAEQWGNDATLTADVSVLRRHRHLAYPTSTGDSFLQDLISESGIMIGRVNNGRRAAEHFFLGEAERLLRHVIPAHDPVDSVGDGNRIGKLLQNE